MNIKINMPKGEEFTNLRRPQSSTIPFLDENKKEENNFFIERQRKYARK